MKDLGHASHQKRFCQTRRPGNQAMRAGEKTDKKLFDYVFLTDNGFREFVRDLIAPFSNLIDKCLFFGFRKVRVAQVGSYLSGGASSFWVIR